MSSSFDEINDLRVTKRDGSTEIVAFDKILNRLKTIGKQSIGGIDNLKINYTTLAMKVIDQLYDGIHTTQIDELSAEQCASMASTHPDYNVLAGRIVVSNYHKNTLASFSQTMAQLYENEDNGGNSSPLLSEEAYLLSQKYADELDDMCQYERDYLIDYFGFKTLERAYLIRVKRRPIERPQHLWLRVALGIHGDDLTRVRETYEYMSQKYFTHATPTLFNSGTPHQQLSSCYLIAMESDSIDGIYNTLKDCALISKWAGGIGMHIHNIRASGSYIRGTGGSSNGIAPMLRVFNNTAKYVDQCLTPQTILYTTRGPIRICEAVAGITEVWNTEGKTEVVANVLEHVYDGELYEIRGEWGVLRSTPEHLVYGLSNYRPLDDPVALMHELEAGLLQCEWIDAKYLTPGDYIAHTIPDDSCIRDFAELTLDVCSVYGKILASIQNFDAGDRDEYQSPGAYRPDTYYYVKNTPEKIREITDFLTSRCIPYFHVDVGKPPAGAGAGEGEKMVYWEKSVHLPFKTTDFWCPRTGRVQVGERWLCLPVEKTAALVESLEIGTIPEYQASFLRLRAGKLLPGEIRFQNQRFVPVLSVSKTHYSGVVYDLQMTTTHNYLVEGGIVHNGGGKRNGSFAIYLEPWHADVELFLQMRKNHGDEELKARDLFYALWVPDLFMERIKSGGTWTLFCPDECPGLSDVYGEAFVRLYTQYETEGRGRKTMQARDLWFQIMDAQMETGTPYLLYKDASNEKSNQKNLGTIKSSNLCVAPETRILTDEGNREIHTLCGQTVNVWNGHEWSSVEVKQTGIDQSLLTVYFRRPGKSAPPIPLRCTPYHRFYVLSEGGDFRECIAKHLTVGMRLIPLTLPENIDPEVEDELESYDDLEVCGVCDFGEIDDTYCFTEPKRHLGVFNGILTGQCTEIIQYSDDTETAVCNLASIALPLFIQKSGEDEPAVFDYAKLHEITKIVVYNLNRVIDVNFYPTEKTCRSNLRHRPVGLGVQGLADVFMMMDLAFHSDEAKRVNRLIFETIYHAAIEKSNEIAKERYEQYGDHFRRHRAEGTADAHFTEWEYTHLDDTTCGAYSTFRGSPASEGILQFDMWNVVPSTRYDWSALRESIRKYGLRNSLLLAPMPTASTSQILGFNECIEPITSNIYSRRTIAGEFIMANKYLMNDLLKRNLWNERIKNNIIANNGSIQQIDAIPPEIREKYRTVWEIPMRHIIDMAADRGAYICQSQSLNLWMEDPNYNTLTSMHFYSWKKGLKTGIYYLRRRGKHQAQQFTIEPEKKVVDTDEHEICEMCSS